MQQIRPQDLARWLEDTTRKAPVLLDVREEWEVRTASLPGIVHMPMQTVPDRLAELNPDEEIVCICHHGMRSMQVALFLEHHGFGKVINLAGGIDAVSRTVYPHIPVY
jgi:rhodanese-related sulfurtransferase